MLSNVQMFQVVVTAAIAATSFLLALKIIEISIHARMAAKLSAPSELWPFTKWLLRLPNPHRQFLAGIVFRYKVLMPLQALLVMMTPHQWARILGATLLLLGVWIEVVRILIDRLYFGVNDSNFRSALATQLPLNEIQISKTETTLTRLRRFVFLTFGLATISTFAYAGIYCAIDGPTEPSSFSNVQNDKEKPLHLLYFSITTTATVGYGDVTPKPESERVLYVRLLVASQMVINFAILIVLVVSVSLTFLPEPKREA